MEQESRFESFTACSKEFPCNARSREEGLLAFVSFFLHFFLKKVNYNVLFLLVYRRMQNQHCVHIAVLLKGIKVRLLYLKILFRRLGSFSLLLKMNVLLVYTMYVSTNSCIYSVPPSFLIVLLNTNKHFFRMFSLAQQRRSLIYY